MHRLSARCAGWFGRRHCWPWRSAKRLRSVQVRLLPPETAGRHVLWCHPPPPPPFPGKSRRICGVSDCMHYCFVGVASTTRDKEWGQDAHVTTLPFCLLQITASTTNMAQPGRQHSRCKQLVSWSGCVYGMLACTWQPHASRCALSACT